MRTKIFILMSVIMVVLAPASLFGQKTLTAEDKQKAAETVYRLLDRYAAYSQLKSYDKSITSQEVVNRYLALFVSEAEVVGDIKPEQMGKRTSKPNSTTIEAYVDEILQSFPNGLASAEVNNAVIDFSELENDQVTIRIKKTISGKAMDVTGVGTSLYRSQTEQLLTINFVNGYGVAKIVKSTLISGSIDCVDCTEQGPVEIHYKTPFAFGLTLMADGPLSTLLGNEPDYSKFNYKGLLAADGRHSNYKSKLGYGGAINLQFDFMFTDNQNVGFALAVGYSHQYTVATLDSLHLRYVASNSSPRADNSFYYNEFLRLNTASTITEKSNTDNAGVSLLFKYQSPVSQKVGFFVQFGPTFNFYNQTSTKYSATVDHEAIYQPKAYYNQFDPSGAVGDYDLLLTRDFTQKNIRDGNQTVESIFEKRARSFWDVFLNKKAEGKVANKFSLAVGGVVAAGAVVRLANKVHFLAGVNVNVIHYSGNSIYNRELQEDKQDYYKSMQYATKSALRINYGLTIGLKFNLAKVNINE